METDSFTERHQQHAVLTETDDLGADLEVIATRPNIAKFAEAYIGTVRLDDEPRNTGDRTDALHRRQVADLRTEHIDERRNEGGHTGARLRSRAISFVWSRASVRPKRLLT